MRHRLLVVLLVVELALGWLWIAPVLLVRDPGLGMVAILFMTAPFQLVCMLIAVWRFIKHPAERGLAFAVFVTPIALVVLPGMLRSAGDPPLFGVSGDGVAVALLAPPVLAPLLLCLFAPRWVARCLPRLLVQSRALHVGAVVLTVLGWLAWLGLVAAFVVHSRDDSSGILFGAFIACSLIGALGCATLALYSWVSLWSPHGRRNRGLRIAQLALSLPMVPLVFLTMFLRTFEGGPG